MRIKNWEKFQHFKDRTPPWIKLYRDLLDDPDWHELDGNSAKVLVMLWLLASEDKDKKGNLPCIRKLSFRLRMPEDKITKEIQRLKHWLILDDISAISSRYQDDAPETETETERETERASVQNEFEIFYQKYPLKKARRKAQEAWEKLDKKNELPPISEILNALDNQITEKELLKEADEFSPEWKHPATWLNQGCWEDECRIIKKTDDQDRHYL